jgi:predicted anti-sigma-YlaC factor YlaD
VKIFRGHVADQLSRYVEEGHGAKPIERHLAECEQCRAEYAAIQRGIAALEHLPLTQAPPSIWNSIESVLDAPQKQRASGPWRLGFALIGALIVAGSALWIAVRPPARWEVDGLSGFPLVGTTHIARKGHVAPGEWIETDAASRARIKIGHIGSVLLAPNTRARIVATRPEEQRIALAHGEIHAQISAPPRLFFVDIASGTAVDLGCEYSLSTQEDGAGLMQVTRGWVSFQSNGHESLVPAGASCRTRPHAGPGTPFFDDSSDSLKRALNTFDETANRDALDAILSAARVRDTLTLWHLLSRVAADDRVRVYDRMVRLTPAPAGVSKEKVLILDPETLNHWKDELAWTW